MHITDELLKYNEQDLPKSFVSLAVKIEEKVATHAALLIRLNNIDYLHHFPGNEKPKIEIDFNGDGWYIYKILKFLNIEDDNDVASILSHCKRICEKSEITYSYIADGSSHTNKGEFISKMGLPEFGTCVGFCLNTLTSLMFDSEDKSILELSEWDDSEIEEWVDNYGKAQAQKKYPNLDWVLYNSFKKRITPIDYLCSSLFETYPINKKQIETVKPKVLEKILILFQ